jgi:hypothetical protein
MDNGSITKADLLKLIEEIGFARGIIRAYDQDGVFIDGYLDLSLMAKQLNHLCDSRKTAELERKPR